MISYNNNNKNKNNNNINNNSNNNNNEIFIQCSLNIWPRNWKAEVLGKERTLSKKNPCHMHDILKLVVHTVQENTYTGISLVSKPSPVMPLV